MLVQINQAKPDELPYVLDVLDEAALWLRQKNIKQWPERFSDADDWRENRLMAYAEAGNTFLMRVDDQVMGTFSLSGPDPHYADGWPDGPETGLYIYRIAIRRRFSGHALGDYILNWASSRAMALGFRWLRLDCHRHNTGLQRYYEDRGFERVGTLVYVIPDVGPHGGAYERGSGALYQRTAGSIVTTELAEVR